jgi:ribokinase
LIVAGHQAPVITVVGSYVVGLTIEVDRVPIGGETVIGSGFAEGPGGKGSNQAIQVARLGGDAALVAVVGADRFGTEAQALWQAEGVDTTHVAVREGAATGVGFIVVEAGGDNRIVIDRGANSHLGDASVEAAADRISRSRVVLAQLEVPTEAAVAAMRAARAAGAISILNPAPARRLTDGALGLIDVLTPNETELRVLAGRATHDRAGDPLEDGRELVRRGVATVVLTRGRGGALIIRADGELALPAPSVDAIDTTGAGDAFNGALAVGLALGASLPDAVRMAIVAGALACTRRGVVPSLPTAAELAAAGCDPAALPIPTRSPHDVLAR